MMKIGLFGGSFNPIHEGHIAFALAAKKQLQLERVILLPAAVSPFKKATDYASDEMRLEMILRAIQGHNGLEVSDIEYHLPKPSYTIQTIRSFKELYPADELYWLMGADSFADFETWKSPAEIAELANLVTTVRNPYSKEKLNAIAVHYEAIWDTKCFIVDMIPSTFCSNSIRKAIKNGTEPEGLHPANLKFIRENMLYV